MAVNSSRFHLQWSQRLFVQFQFLPYELFYIADRFVNAQYGRIDAKMIGSSRSPGLIL